MHFKHTNHFRLFVSLMLAVLLTTFSLSLSAAGASANGRSHVADVSFTKWITTFPNMTGVVGGDVGAGNFKGEVLSYDPTLANGHVIQIEALYHFNGGAHSFTADVHVLEFNSKVAVISGVVTDGWLRGAVVIGEYRVISCNQAADHTCYQGNLHLAGF